MSYMNDTMNARTRAYPVGDAQAQHPAPSRSIQGLSHYSGRGRRKKLVQEKRWRMCTWNVGSMTGRGAELAATLKRRRMNVACVQETKWKGMKAKEIGEGYKLYYSGRDGKRNGVGVILDSEWKKNVVDVHRVSDRIICVKTIINDSVKNFISAYAPQAGLDEKTKEIFWGDMDTVLVNIPNNEDVFVGGDFNGHVGYMNYDFERIHGGKGFGARRNSEGESLLEMATAYDLAILNTYFKKKDEHLITYKSGNNKTQIDFILTRRNKMNTVKDCKVIPGEPLTSQHRLLVAEYKAIIKKNFNIHKPEPKIKWWLLERMEFKEAFVTRMKDEMGAMNEMSHKTVDECWQSMADYIRKTAISVVGVTKGATKISKETWWWNEEIQGRIKEKKNAFKEWQRNLCGTDIESQLTKTSPYLAELT
ncbi:hypothetical protein K1T71_009274 [Dendrolimus kikuchii]|uniref:Uncharacterized protein n=1 Tax=Dendrolimus kikuchii TaxID=765133 RepID=A0ACC1CTZ1_9NEOP|nr:hypothetical protein K1T71_009274 [Dendrolimus kikuchii]